MIKIINGNYVIASFFSYREADFYFTYELDHYRYPNAEIICDDDQLAEKNHL